MTTQTNEPPVRRTTQIIGPRGPSLREHIRMSNEQVLAVTFHLIGTRYTPEVKEVITALTGRPRVVGPQDISTRDYDNRRVHIRVDAAGVIEGFAFA